MKTGKIVSFGSRSKHCRICQRAKSSNKVPRVHKCHQNFSGSAKAMEPDIVCSMLGDIKSQGHTVKTLIGDDDATGYARARKEVFSHLEKHSDKNHLRKNITKKLYALKHVHKKSISTMIIKSLTKNFNYMLDQNRGNPDGIEKGLESVVEHMYGNHNYCSLEWCGALKNQQSHNKEHAEYKHSNLPYGRDLSDQELKADLKQIFEPLKARFMFLQT